MKATVLLVALSRKHCGNFSTVSRIRSHLEKNGITCILRDPADFPGIPDYLTFLQSHHVDLVIGINAYKSGCLLRGSTVPCIVILGGTDMNECCNDTVKVAVMMETIHRAGCIISFSESMKQKLHAFMPEAKSKPVMVIPQAVSVSPSSFNIEHYLKEKHPSLFIDSDCRIFIMVAGIRRVKNPLFLVQEFSDWSVKHKDLKALLLILGPKVEEDYCEVFLEKIESLPGVVYEEGLEMADTHAAIRDSFLLVNSSNSEGMSLALLEAMVLETPVLVRGNPGNLAVVKDGTTGLVYQTPQEFLQKVELLLSDTDLRMTITQNALDYVNQQHSMATEEALYLSAVQEVMKETQ